MYELLAGFLAGLATILLMNRIFVQKNRTVLKEFDSVLNELKSGGK